VGVTEAANGGTKALFSQAYQEFWLPQFCRRPAFQRHSLRNDDSDFIKNRNSYPLWNGSLKRDIQGFKPGMTESEAKQRLSDCGVSGHKILCPVPSKDERFELSLTEHTRPRLVKEVTYVFPAGGATLETMAKNVMVQFGVGNSRQCLPPAPGDKPMFSMAVGRRIIPAIRSRHLSKKYVSVSVNAEMDYQSGRAGI
jgi:hypothetical protein